MKKHRKRIGAALYWFSFVWWTSAVAQTTQMPQTQMPQTQMPQTQMPQTQMPQTQMPQTQMPQTHMPQTHMPKIGGESFAGRSVVLPDDTKGKVAVLVLGFTKASKAPTSDLAKKLTADFAGKAEIYQLPVLEDVPRLIRSMVISSIKKGVPENQREHFVPILRGEAELKKFVNYKELDDAYLIVLDSASNVIRQQHGGTDDTTYSALRSQIETLLSVSK